MMTTKIASMLVLAATAGGCVWTTDLPNGAKSIAVDRTRELIVTDDAILGGPLGTNATSGALSFRRATQGLGMDGAATLRWLDAWSRRLRDEGATDRASAFDSRVTCAWLRRVADNRCDDACASCAASTLRLEDAPFRPIAVVNRTDLSVMPDRAADGGEGRIVFALTDGPADDPRSPPLPMTVIFEYAQRGTAFDWVTRWHALGSASDADFPDQLATLTQLFVASGSLAQIRTADALTGPMVLHQFELASGELVASNVRNTPDWTRVPAASVRDYVDAHASAVTDGTYVLPSAWWASSSSSPEQPPDWVADMPQHDALMNGTCGGCHAKAASHFQIDPMAVGDAKLSRFLSDATHSADELRRRTEWMQMTLWSGP